MTVTVIRASPSHSCSPLTDVSPVRLSSRPRSPASGSRRGRERRLRHRHRCRLSGYTQSRRSVEQTFDGFRGQVGSGPRSQRPPNVFDPTAMAIFSRRQVSLDRRPSCHQGFCLTVAGPYDASRSFRLGLLEAFRARTAGSRRPNRTGSVVPSPLNWSFDRSLPSTDGGGGLDQVARSSRSSFAAHRLSPLLGSEVSSSEWRALARPRSVRDALGALNGLMQTDSGIADFFRPTVCFLADGIEHLLLQELVERAPGRSWRYLAVILKLDWGE